MTNYEMSALICRPARYLNIVDVWFQKFDRAYASGDSDILTIDTPQLHQRQQGDYGFGVEMGQC